MKGLVSIIDIRPQTIGKFLKPRTNIGSIWAITDLNLILTNSLKIYDNGVSVIYWLR